MSDKKDKQAAPAQELGIPKMPVQQWTTVYELRRGLKAGTIFPDLDMPFYMGGVTLGK